MIQAPDKKFQPLIEKIYEYNQEQVFRFWDELNETEKNDLLKQISTINFDLMSKLSQNVINDVEKEKNKNIKEGFSAESIRKRNNRV